VKETDLARTAFEKIRDKGISGIAVVDDNGMELN
jgi:hypothetical protein